MEQTLRKIYETFDAGEIAFLKSLLDASGITYFVENELVVPFFSHSGIPLILKVADADWQEAQEIIQDFEKKKTEP